MHIKNPAANPKSAEHLYHCSRFLTIWHRKMRPDFAGRQQKTVRAQSRTRTVSIKKNGYPAWIRTRIKGTKIPCAAVAPRGNSSPCSEKKTGALGGIRTHDLRLRRATLYPIELRAQHFIEYLSFGVPSRTIRAAKRGNSLHMGIFFVKITASCKGIFNQSGRKRQ